MNDKELADAVVALGIGEYVAGAYWLATGPDPIKLDSSEFVRDPRVAMALMEKCLASGIDVSMSLQSNYFEAPGFWITGTVMALSQDIETESDGRGSLPRAIIEACVEALK